MAISSEDKTKLLKVVVGLFDAAPGSAFLPELEAAVDGGMSVRDVAKVLVTKSAFTDGVMGGATTPAAQAEILAGHFGLTADGVADSAASQAIAYFTAGIEGGADIGDLVTDAVEFLARTDLPAAFAETATLLANKAAVAGAYSAIAGNNSTDLAVLQAVMQDARITGSAPLTQAEIDQIVASFNSDTVTLTSGIDIVEANVFNAPRAFTPGGTDQVNTLDDDDELTGVGDNPTLNFTYVRDADIGAGANTTITPQLNGVETVNIAFAGSAGNYTLDLQDATGIKNINIDRVADGLTAMVRNVAEADANNVTVNNVRDPNNTLAVTYLDAALRGSADVENLKLNNVHTINQFRLEGNLAQQGFETLNLTSSGDSNSIQQFATKSLQTAVIDGDAELTVGGSTPITRTGAPNAVEEGRLYQAAFTNVTGTLSKIDASGLSADLTINLGAEVVATKAGTSGVPVDFDFKGTELNDTVRLLAGLDRGDVIDLGGGTNAVAIMATAQEGSIKNAGTLQVLGQSSVNETIGVDAKIITGLESVYVRNEGNDPIIPVPPNPKTLPSAQAKVMTTNLLDLDATSAGNVTVAHGTTGNNAVGSQVLQIDGASGVTTVGVQIVDGVNADPRFNLTLYTDNDLTLNPNGTVASGQNNNLGANAVTSLNLNDSDTESNTVMLTAQGYTASGGVKADGGTAYTETITLTGADTAEGKFFNLDATGNAFGINQTGANGNTAFGLAALARDTAFSSVYDNTNYAVDAGGEGVGYVYTASNANAAMERLIAKTINAGTYKGDVIARVGQADQAITTNTGNDTIIFDATNDNRAGLTIADKVHLGAGKDTVVIDGGYSGANVSQTIALGASEWTNLTGVDVLRLGSNAANAAGDSGYRLTITDQLVAQADAGDRITIINNDGDLTAATANNAIIDMRQSNGLSATKFVDFYGENGDTVNAGNAVAAPDNRVILSDATANGGHNLDGGDRDLRTTYADTAAWLAGNQGNGNTTEYRNTAVVTEGDQAGIKNFSTIVFNNDQAVLQTLTLELTNKVADALADASHTASATQQETLTIRANDGSVPAPLAGAALNIDGSKMSNAYVLNVRTDDNNGANNLGVADTISLNDNVGGTGGHTVDLLDGAGNDTLTFYGATGDQWSTTGTTINVAGTTNTGSAIIQNNTGLATSTHTLEWDNGDIIRLTQDNGATFTTLQAGSGNLTFNGSVAADTIIGTAGNNTITGGLGADVLTGGLGADTFVYATGDTGITLATADTITDFNTANDLIQTGLAGATEATIADGGALVLGGDQGLTSFITAADAVLTAGVGANDGIYVAYNVAGTGNAYVVVDHNDSGSVDAGDSLIVLTGIDLVGEIALANFI